MLSDGAQSALQPADSVKGKTERTPRAAKLEIPERLDKDHNLVWFLMAAHWDQNWKSALLLLGLFLFAFGLGFGAARVEIFASIVSAVNRVVKAPYDQEKVPEPTSALKKSP